MKWLRCPIVADSNEELEKGLGMFDGTVFPMAVSLSTPHLKRGLLLHSNDIVGRHRLVAEEGTIEHTVGFVNHQMQKEGRPGREIDHFFVIGTRAKTPHAVERPHPKSLVFHDSVAGHCRG